MARRTPDMLGRGENSILILQHAGKTDKRVHLYKLILTTMNRDTGLELSPLLLRAARLYQP